MHVKELGVPGALELTPQPHRDDRGVFLEWFRAETFAGRPLEPLVRTR